MVTTAHEQLNQQRLSYLLLQEESQPHAIPEELVMRESKTQLKQDEQAGPHPANALLRRLFRILIVSEPAYELSQTHRAKYPEQALQRTPTELLDHQRAVGSKQ